MFKRILVGLAFFAAGTVSAQIASAQNVADVYKNRTVTLLMGYSVGGTYGQTTLLLSNHIGKHIPGNPTVIMQSMPGAGGLKMTNYAYNVLPKNGLNIMMPPEMILVSELLRPKRVKYKTTKFTSLGTVFGANQIMIVRRDTGIRSIADLRKKQVIVASTGTGSPTYLVPAMMNGVLKTKFKIVTGYKGSAGTSLSVERGETFGMTNSWVSWKANRPQWFNKPEGQNFVVKLCQVGFYKEKDLPNLPLLTELATNDDDRAAAAMLSTASIIGRGLAMPPGVPARLIETLRTAFWATVNDPEFKAEAAKSKLPVIPIKGAELQSTIESAMAKMSPSAIAKARRYVFGTKPGRKK
jgi:tripartite-type tricarboxylate transporter receptor subunit TctC